MKKRHRLFYFFMAAFACTCLFNPFTTLAENTPPAVENPQNTKILLDSRHRAEEFCARNLNRFGLNELQRYDKALDSLAANEKQDTVAALQRIFDEKFRHRRLATDSLTNARAANQES